MYVAVLAGLAGLAGCVEVVRGVGSEPGPVEADTGERAGEAPQEASSACGPTHLVDMEFEGRLVYADGSPGRWVPVRLEQRDWGALVVHGEGTTEDDGRFYLIALDLPIVEGCWGIGPQFYLVGEIGALYGEVGVNMQIVGAWRDGSFLVEQDEPPLIAQ